MSDQWAPVEPLQGHAQWPPVSGHTTHEQAIAGLHYWTILRLQELQERIEKLEKENG